MGEQESQLSAVDGQRSVWMQTRVSLIQRLRGETPAQEDWQDFYKMYWRPVYTFARRFGISGSDAEDLVQEVMITLLRNLPSFGYDRAKGRFLSWVKSITRNKVIDWHRRQKARVEGRLQRAEPGGDGEDVIEKIAAPGAASTKDAWDEEWENAVLAMALERVRGRVDADTFDVFRQYVVEGVSAEDVALGKGVSINTVYQIRKRVLAYLKEEALKIHDEV
jgi:RNA polymerase sigma-70 factor, ECF subfamily